MHDMYRALKHRILKNGLIPIVTLTLALGALSTVLAMFQAQKNFEQQVKITTEQITLMASSAMAIQNPESTRALARMSLQMKGLYGLRIINDNGHVIYQAGPPFQVSNWPGKPGSRAAMLQQDNALLTTTQLQPSLNGNNTYWLELEFEKEALQLEQYQWLLMSGAAATLCLLLAIVASLRLANIVTTSLERITTAVGRVMFTNLDTRIPTEQALDFEPLTQHVNSLLARMQIRYRDMKSEVDIAADEIQRNMETLEINNAELDLSRKRAIEANQAKSVFLANMSHEMRTPLNSISGYTELMKRSHVDDIQREHLRTISTAADSLLAIIDDILDFAKLEAGKLHLENAPFNLRKVVDEVLAMNSPAAQKKNLELAAIFHPSIPLHLTGDANRLKQIITNLFSNAIKFTETGSVIVQVMCEKLINQQVILRISVEDTGIGITPEDSRKLFQAFSQINASRSRNNDGTGLGLVICKSLVEQMQGNIDFESKPGRGTRFWFTIQLPLDQQTQKQPLHTPQRGIALVQERRPWSRQAITGLLEEQGFQVRIIKDGQPGNITSQFPELPDASLVVIGLHSGDSAMTTLPEIASHLSSDCRLLILSDPQHLEHLHYLRTPGTAILPHPLSQVRLTEAIEQLYNETSDGAHTTNIPSLQEFPHLRILAVDDNEPNLKLLATMLGDMGIHVDTASSGHEALKQVASNDYALVFMDIQMPGMDGLETTAHIRSAEKMGFHLPIIALTAHAMAEEKAELLAAGMDDYLTKPVSEQQLIHVIKLWTEHQAPVKPSGTSRTEATVREHQTAQANTRRGSNYSPSPVDRAEGIKLAGDREELADELLDMLLKSLEPTRKEIVSYADQNSSQELMETVHKLHGATRYCGVPELREACHTLESLLKQNREHSQRDNAIQELLEEIDRLLVWQERHMALSID